MTFNKVFNLLIEPRFSIYLIALSVNLGSLQIVPGFTQITFAKVLIVLSSILLIIKSLHFARKIYVDTIFICIFLFTVFSIPSLLSSVENKYLLIILTSFIGYLCLHVVIYNSITSLPHIKNALIFYIIGGTIQSIIIVFGTYTNISFDEYNYRPSGSFENANAAAYVTAVATIFGFALIMSYEKIKRRLLILATGICFIGLVLTLSRGGYSLMIASLLVISFYSSNKIRTIVLVSIGFVLALVILFSPDASLIFKRIMSLSNPLDDLALQYRIYSIIPAIELFQDNWLFGIGFMNYQFQIPKNLLEDSSTTIHIVLLGIATEMGVLCLITYISVICLIFKRLISNIRKQDDQNIRFILIMFLATIAGQLTFGLTHFSLLNASFWLTISMATVACKILPKYSKTQI